MDEKNEWWKWFQNEHDAKGKFVSKKNIGWKNIMMELMSKSRCWRRWAGFQAKKKVGEEGKKQDESEDEGCKHVAQQIFFGWKWKW